MKTLHFVERPWDEYYNRGYTAKQPYVIKAKYEPGEGKPGTFGAFGTLHVVSPDFIRNKWPTLSERFFMIVDLPEGPLDEDEWLAMFGAGNE